MINLLPPSHASAVRREYRYRLFVVGLALFLGTALLGIFFLLPSYLLSEVKIASLKERAALVSGSAERIEGEETVKALSLLEKEVGLLRVGQIAAPASAFIESVIVEKDSSITIRGISYEKRGETAKVDIAGTAKTRAALLSFVDRLKKKKEFAEVHSPISNLVKEKDIEFSIQVAISP